MTVVNPPPTQEMKSTDDKQNPEASSAKDEHTDLEMQAL